VRLKKLLVELSEERKAEGMRDMIIIWYCLRVASCRSGDSTLLDQNNRAEQLSSRPWTLTTHKGIAIPARTGCNAVEGAVELSGSTARHKRRLERGLGERGGEERSEMCKRG
jgi:hypothetical protein